MKSILLAAVDVTGGYSEDTGGIPGAEKAKSIVSGLRGWGLILCVGAIVIAAIIWAFGAQSQNQAQATQGKKGVLIAILCAAVIIAAPELVKWGVDVGNNFK